MFFCSELCFSLPITFRALCSGRSVILAAGLSKAVPGVKVLFLDQIPKRPCQPDMSLGFILSLSIYSDGHCTKPCVSCRYLTNRKYLLASFKIGNSSSSTFSFDFFGTVTFPIILLFSK